VKPVARKAAQKQIEKMSRMAGLPIKAKTQGTQQSDLHLITPLAPISQPVFNRAKSLHVVRHKLYWGTCFTEEEAHI
jgi:hypothetical protein